jgi:hypothetical protein
MGAANRRQDDFTKSQGKRKTTGVHEGPDSLIFLFFARLCVTLFAFMIKYLT